MAVDNDGNEILIGDIVLIDSVIPARVKGFSVGHRLIPDGWLDVGRGNHLNPKLCRLYKGATSAVEHLLTP